MSVSSAANTSANSVETLQDNGESSCNQYEYETQYFGFTPKSFSNGVYNAVNDYVMDGLEVVEVYINSEYGDVISPGQVNEGIQKIQQRIAKKIDKAFDTLEAYLLLNIFCIPEKAVLPEDQVKQEKPFTADGETQILKQVQEYREKILAVKYANTCLQRELQDIDEAQRHMDNMLTDAQEMNQVMKNVGVSDVKDSLVYASSQLKKRIDILKTVQVVTHNSEDEKV